MNRTGRAGASRWRLSQETIIQFYHAPGACGLADHIALHDAGFDFDPLNQLPVIALAVEEDGLR